MKTATLCAWSLIADLYIQEFVKTQFAGVPAHIQLVSLLKDFQGFFLELKVEDEGEYWETGDEGALAEHIQRCDKTTTEMASKNPSARIKVRSPSGRLIDLIE